MDTTDGDLEHRCRELIDRLLVRYAWRLLTREELLQRTIVAAREDPATELSYLVFGIYNHALHTACSGAEGPLRWEQGYHEIFAMLCDRARRRYPDIWEDAVQSAIELTCKHFDRCAVPQAFFQFAWGHLQNAARSLRPQLRRKTQSPNISLEYTAGPKAPPLADRLEDPKAYITDQVLAEELRAELHLALQRFEQAHPRARNQLTAVRLKYLDGKSDEAISQILGVPVKRVHELRSLGLKKLREDSHMRGLLGDDSE
jgi:RNA polymerase sigma factor (sigma-70 family)